MRNFEVLRYIKRWRFLIIAVCILGALLVYMYGMSQQVYTAQTVLRYSNSEAKSGMTPSGDTLDVSEIYSSNVITGVLEDLDMDIGADAIRSRCSVTPIVSADEEARKEAILEEGEEYEYYPTDYLVSFGVDSDNSPEYAASVLDSILKNYFISYGEKYINQTVLPNDASNIESGSYDYIECAEILDASATEIYNYLYDKMYHYPDFRSAATGYTFSDLYKMYREDLNYNIPELYSKILNQKVSVDQEVLIKDYKNRLSQYDIELTNMEEKINPLYDLITQYSNKSKEGIQYHYGKGSDSDNTNDYILKDVYEDVTNEENTTRVNTETTYDALINSYVSLEVGRQYTQVDKEHREELLTIFEDATPAVDTDAAVREIQQEMAELINHLDTNYETVKATVDEFNQYLGASNITPLSSITVSERVNLGLYLILALVVFLVFGCLGAILLGRTQDFIEYLLYTDRKTGLGNRTKCDMLINSYAEKPLPDNFTFILIRLDVLKKVNSEVGRTAGDAMLKDFGRIMRALAEDYGFAGYNGSDQFMCMFENCSYHKAEMFIENLKSYIAQHNVQNPEQPIEFSYAVEETENKGVYDMRALISASFRDINSNSSSGGNPDKSDGPDKNDPDPNGGGNGGGGNGGGSPSPAAPAAGPAQEQTPAAMPQDMIKIVTDAVLAGMKIGGAQAASAAQTGGDQSKSAPEALKTEESVPQQRPSGRSCVYGSEVIREEDYISDKTDAEIEKSPYPPLFDDADESKAPKAEYKAVLKNESAKAEPDAREVEVVVKDGSSGVTAFADETVHKPVEQTGAGIETVNPYAPKPRAKRSYRTSYVDEPSARSEYAPKRREKKL